MSWLLWYHGLLQHARLLCPWDSPSKILEWVAIPFFRGASWPRDRTRVSCIAGRCFTNWATREALGDISSVQLLSRLQTHGLPGDIGLTYQSGKQGTILRVAIWRGGKRANPHALTIRVHSARDTGECFRAHTSERHQPQSCNSQSPAASLLLSGMLSPGWKIRPHHVCMVPSLH